MYVTRVFFWLGEDHGRWGWARADVLFYWMNGSVSCFGPETRSMMKVDLGFAKIDIYTALGCFKDQDSCLNRDRTDSILELKYY